MELSEEPDPCSEGDHGKFELTARDGLARIGQLHTNSHILETPTLLPVVNPNILTIPPREMWEEFGVYGLITNSYVIWKHEKLKADALENGVHALLDYPGFVMTDSGTFQDYVYGDVELEPEQIVTFQRDIGVDVGTMLDVFGTPDMTVEELTHAVEETAARAPGAIAAAGETLLNGPIQGGPDLTLRRRSVDLMSAHPFCIHPIGGIVPLMEQQRYLELVKLLLACRDRLPPERPIHMFGCGHPLLFPLAVALGVDLFDSAAYALFARDDRIITPEGTLHLAELREWPFSSVDLDGYTPAAVRAMPDDERTAVLARHNLRVSMAELARCREAIRDGNIWHLVERRAAENPALQEATQWLFDEGLAMNLELIAGPCSPQRAGGVSWTPNLVNHPGMLSAYAHTICWEPPDVDMEGEPLTEGLHKFVLINGVPPPWRMNLKTLIRDLYSNWPQVVPLVHTPFGPIPFEAEDINPFGQIVGPDWLFECDAQELGEEWADAQIPLRMLINEWDDELNVHVVDGRGETKEIIRELTEVLGQPRAIERPMMNFDPPVWERVWEHQKWLSVRAKLLMFCDWREDVVTEFLDGASYVCNRHGRVKNVLDKVGVHILSPRLKDGGISLTLEGARWLHNRAELVTTEHQLFDENWEPVEGSFRQQQQWQGLPNVVVDEHAEPFIRSGRSVMHFSVLQANGELTPGLPCAIENEAGEFLGHGISNCTKNEAGRFLKGVAVKVKDGAGN